ncbi:MAG: hypothetical protein K2P39_13640 [Lachnospiraceae bacterium]|nr:hypothetical protein [Lachnospiraceae bacterium]
MNDKEIQFMGSQAEQKTQFTGIGEKPGDENMKHLRTDALETLRSKLRRLIADNAENMDEIAEKFAKEYKYSFSAI